MANTDITKEEIQAVFPKVAETMADALGCDVEDVKLDVSLIEGLDAESMAFGLAHAADHQAIGDVLQHVHVREQGVVLKDGVDRTAIGGHALDGLAENLDVPSSRLIETCDQPQACRLARARRAEHCEKLTRNNVEINAVDRLHGAEIALDVAK